MKSVRLPGLRHVVCSQSSRCWSSRPASSDVAEPLVGDRRMRHPPVQRLARHRQTIELGKLLGCQGWTEIGIALSNESHSIIANPIADPVFDGRPIALCRIDAAPFVLIRSSSRRTWRSLKPRTRAADTSVIRPSTTFDKTSIRCRSRSLIAINPIGNLPGHQNPGRVTFLLCRNRTLQLCGYSAIWDNQHYGIFPRS